MEKFCKTCKYYKHIDYFHKKKKMKDGYSNKCISCTTDYNIAYNAKNKEKIKAHYINNKDEKRKYQQEYKRKNRKIINQRRSDYVNKNNNVKIASLLRTRVYFALKLKNSTKAYSTIEMLGCSIDFFKEYIESKFTKNMNWDNYGVGGWHFDHIKPCSSFDLSDPEQQKLCFHYTNIQPLWETTAIAVSYGETENYIGNLNKSDNIIPF